MNKLLIALGFLGLVVISCGENGSGNKSIFSTKEAESGVYSKEPHTESHGETTHEEDKHEADTTKAAKHEAGKEAKHETEQHTEVKKDSAKVSK